MKTMTLALGLVWGFVAAGSAEVRAATAERPNIICILADDYGISGMGCYGGSYKTPHLDALAAGGMNRREFARRAAPEPRRAGAEAPIEIQGRCRLTPNRPVGTP